jgi:hypothetical protein
LVVLHLLFAVHCVSALLAVALTRPSRTCMYTAVAVLLAAKLCPVLENELGHNTLEVSWKKCIVILRSLEDRYESAKRCLATLEVFRDQIIASSEEAELHSPTAMQFPAPPRLLVLPSPGQQVTDEQADGEADIAREGDGSGGTPTIRCCSQQQPRVVRVQTSTLIGSWSIHCGIHRMESPSPLLIFIFRFPSFPLAALVVVMVAGAVFCCFTDTTWI